MNRIITIGRQFGSGGRELGRRVAQALDIAYYDREIVTEIVNRTQLSEAYVQQVVEHRPNPLYPITIGQSFPLLLDPTWEMNRSIYREQTNVILEMAKKSDCVIVGRCADDILKDHHPLRLFVYAQMEHRLRRTRKYASPTNSSVRNSSKGRFWIWTRTGLSITAFTPGKSGEIKRITISA